MFVYRDLISQANETARRGHRAAHHAPGPVADADMRWVATTQDSVRMRHTDVLRHPDLTFIKRRPELEGDAIEHLQVIDLLAEHASG